MEPTLYERRTARNAGNKFTQRGIYCYFRSSNKMKSCEVFNCRTQSAINAIFNKNTKSYSNITFRAKIRFFSYFYKFFRFFIDSSVFPQASGRFCVLMRQTFSPVASVLRRVAGRYLPYRDTDISEGRVRIQVLRV